MLEARWRNIRDEAVAIRTADISALSDISFDHGRVAADRRWKSLFLKGSGYRMASNCARAPVTAPLIEKIPGLITASFSVMEGAVIFRAAGT